MDFEYFDCDEMIVAPELFAAQNSTMNCGIQYDSRHVFPGLNMDSPWMGHHVQATVKQEPRDDGEYGYVGKSDKSCFTSPLTPPGLNTPYSFPTPQSDYPASTSPQNFKSMPSQESPPAAGPESKSPRLTPPGSIPSPCQEQAEKNDIQDGGSQSSNSENEYFENGDSLRRLQMALQRTGMMPEEKLQCPMCEFFCNIRSQFNEHLVSHETKCNMCDFNGETADKLREHMKSVHDCDDENMWIDDEPGLNTPKVNSQGKVKTFRCKQCDFSAVTKLEFWEHSRSHIKQERILNCPKCPFVTEYKHHLEYHLRNHFGSKPFKCDKCSYSCVNKSMLNSHLKSHSNVYQFRCADCTYATKYCHSLKLHLRKYNHNPAMVLNPDGSPNPLPIVDVYGTKRGPKQKPKISPEKSAPPQQQQVSMPMFNPYSLLPTQMPYYNLLNGLTPFPFSQEMKVEEKNNNVEKEITEETKDEIKTPLDLTCSDRGETDKHSTTQVETPVLKNRRKGKAFKLERIPLLLQSQSDEEPEQIVTKPDLYPEECKSPEVKSCEADSEQPKTDKAEKTDEYNCSFCDISFKDIVMYTMHMGYHGYQDPFTCNMCGQQTSDKVSFFLHIARTSHL